MEKELVCTCWDVDAEGCELHRMLELDGYGYDWDDVYEGRCDEVLQREIDVPLLDVDDELPF